jgi:uncharacterized membrane protein YfcA
MSLAAGPTTFAQHLVLWLHIALATFTVGPITLAISSTPRYIRRRNVGVLRYLSRITFIFMIASIGVLIAGVALGQMLKVASKPWMIVSATLFLVAIVLLVLIVGDQRRAIRAIDETAEQPAAGLAGDDVASQADTAADDVPGADQAPASPGHHLATVERGRIAMLGGVVNLIFVVILILMVWNS